MKTNLKKLILLLVCCLCEAFLAHAEEVDVYLIGGQSNATGQAYMRNLPQTFRIDTSVLFYYSKYLNRGRGGEVWRSLCQASESIDKFGPELSLGTALKKYYPHRKIALIKHGLAGSNLFAQWNPGNRQGEQRGAEFEKWYTTVQNALESLRKQGHTPIIRAMVWQQGEADARYDAGEANSLRYGENLKNLIEEVRRLLNAPDMLFVYGEVMPMAAERFSKRDVVRKAQVDVSEAAQSPLSVSKAYLVEGDDLQMRRTDYMTPYPDDDVHLGTYGMLTLGNRFAKVIFEKQKL